MAALWSWVQRYAPQLILLALLAVAEYGNYQRGEELARICEL